MRRFLAPLLVLTALLWAAPATAQSNLKIAVVDFQRALNEAEEGKTAKKNLEQRFEGVRTEMEAKRAEIQQLKEDLEAQAMMLSEAARADKEREYQQKAVEFQQGLMEQQQEMAMLEQELTADILEQLYNVANGVGAEQGYNLILEASGVVFANGVSDITQQVITRFNTK